MNKDKLSLCFQCVGGASLEWSLLTNKRFATFTGICFWGGQYGLAGIQVWDNHESHLQVTWLLVTWLTWLLIHQFNYWYRNSTLPSILHRWLAAVPPETQKDLGCRLSLICRSSQKAAWRSAKKLQMSWFPAETIIGFYSQDFIEPKFIIIIYSVRCLK